jgi:hypothetical protein
MTTLAAKRPITALAMGAIAIVFGVATIVSGGRALFGDEAERQAVGNAVGFVLWFNFAAGFAYVAAGGALLARQAWAAPLAAVIAASTLAVFLAFGVHVLLGGAYEIRTVGAMALRCAVWIVIAIAARRLSAAAVLS